MDIAAREAELLASVKAEPSRADLRDTLGGFYAGQNRHEDAVDAFTAALKIEPKSITYLRNRALSYHALGQLDQAATDIIDAVTLEPRDASLADTLGVLLQDLDRFDEAKVCHAQAIDEDPTNPAYYINLAVAMVKTGSIEAARELYDAVIKMAPAETQAYISLAELYSRGSNHKMAAEVLESAREKGAISIPVLANLGNTYFAMKQHEKAAAIYEQARTLDPENGYVKHMLAVTTGQVEDGASPEYVAHVFDSYAETFEAHLVRGLSYRVPGLVRNELMKVRSDADPLRPNAAKLRILDIGCGTGLGGVMTYDVASYLKGVDLSPKMIAEARAKNIYHDLVVGEIVEVMKADPNSYDIVVAADVFVYLGDLMPVLTAARERLVPGGYLIFSVERVPGTAFSLQPTGRFAHSGDYLVRSLTAAQFSVSALRSEVIRTNDSVQVQGYVAVARRPLN
jgi:predicted TPR repeat methyltransferase